MVGVWHSNYSITSFYTCVVFAVADSSSTLYSLELDASFGDGIEVLAVQKLEKRLVSHITIIEQCNILPLHSDAVYVGDPFLTYAMS
ncbi:unnamed protein product [Larinioides sclopetarius]|uniref:Uncharacterized protein n=1 Tax=Larinioides sclopetarius TaxID=280406 RepID=A0AAV2A952_9ARAC